MKQDKNLLPWLFAPLTLLIAVCASIILPRGFELAYSLNGIDVVFNKVVFYYFPVAVILLMMGGGPWPFRDDAPKYQGWQLISVLAVTALQVALAVVAVMSL